ncbi:MAG: VOC family protein [Mucilaginibacter sp.]
MNTINPYIGFNGKCREAMTFYQECLRGELELQEVAGSPMEQHWAGEMNQIFHSSLTVSGTQLLMGSDMVDQSGYHKGNNIALAMGCSSEAEIRALFDKLSVDGKVTAPLKEQFWGAIFGSLEDKYGIRWMLNYNKQA